VKRFELDLVHRKQNLLLGFEPNTPGSTPFDARRGPTTIRLSAREHGDFRTETGLDGVMRMPAGATWEAGHCVGPLECEASLADC
jgi:hypothetical protein